MTVTEASTNSPPAVSSRRPGREPLFIRGEEGNRTRRLNYTVVVSGSSSCGDVAGAIAHLKTVLGPVITENATIRENHSHGESYHVPAAPDAVCFPRTTDEVIEIMRASAEFGVPVVPFGAGSSLEGHVHALRGGLAIDLTQMNKILRVSQADMDVTVEAGVTRLQLGKALRNTGLMFPVDPGADATIGGMAATRASGTTAVRYGTMREVVLGLTVVLGDSRVIRTGGRARKSSSGYDLADLFVGSEGSLGIITDVTLRLYGLPEPVSASVCPCDTKEGAVQTVYNTMQLGVPVARIEPLDEPQIDAVNRYSHLNYPLKPTLYFEFHATSPAAVNDQAQTPHEIA